MIGSRMIGDYSFLTFGSRNSGDTILRITPLMKYCLKCGKPLTPKVIDQKERLACGDSACGFIYWNNPIPVVGMVVETEKGIILAHNKVMPKGIFSIMTFNFQLSTFNFQLSTFNF
jgi:NADH pyrophosphatase NudC (nudix superfamily)